MAQVKTSQTMLNIEPLFDDLMEDVVKIEGFFSKSSYLRKLVIEDLRKRGLVGEAELLQVLQ